MIVSITNQIAVYFVKLPFYEVLFLCLVLLPTNIIIRVLRIVKDKYVVYVFIVTSSYFQHDILLVFAKRGEFDEHIRCL